MRLATIAIASLLAACTQAEDNAASNADGDLNVDMNLPAPVGSPGDPGNGAVPPESSPPAQPPGNGETSPEPSGEISLRASPQQVSSGATVTLTLSNGTRGRLGYNLCTTALQTASGGEVRTDRVCTLELRTLDAGGNATYAYELPTRIEAGRYRFSTGLERMDSSSRTTVTSNTIEVR